LALPEFAYRRFLCVTPSWDNTARRANIATIFKNANPSDYQKWLEEVLKREISKRQHPSFVFINAWNEWAEGNHLEPCQKWGHAYLEATLQALQNRRQT
jgi:lipopolysaccharide biosynthesis protein